MKKVCIIFFQVSFVACLFGQGQMEEKTVLLFRNERSGAALLNSNGWGANYRYYKRVNYFSRNIFDIDLVLLKDSKEFKSPGYDGSNFIIGKANTCITSRFGYGYQKEIFAKFDKDGISIKYFYSGGLSLTFAKPYYYKVYYAPNPEPVEQTYDHIGYFSGLTKAGFSKGMSEVKIYPGLFVKGGFVFDISKTEEIINAIELGAEIDIYPKDIPIMSNHLNQNLFTTLFVSYRFGKPIDKTPPKNKKNPDFFDDQYL